MRNYINIEIKTESSSTTTTIESSQALKPQIKSVVGRLEKILILDTLTECRWNRLRTAKILDISYRSLLYKMREYNLTNKEVV